MKKWIALFLVIVMCATVLIACDEDGKADDTNKVSADTTDPNRDSGGGKKPGGSKNPDNPDDPTPAPPTGAPEVKDFSGYTFVIRTNGWGDYMYAAPTALNGEGINDETFKRNQEVQSRYNITIREDRIENVENGDVSAFLASQALTNDYFADLFSWSARSMVKSAATQGFFLNVHDLSELRLQGDWWATDMVEEFTINGHAYLFDGRHSDQ